MDGEESEEKRKVREEKRKVREEKRKVGGGRRGKKPDGGVLTVCDM